MGKNFLKQKFRIRRSFAHSGIDHLKELGFIVEVKYWWFPIWMTANLSIIEGDKLSTGYAMFETENGAMDYINRRYVIYTYDDMPKIIGRHGQENKED